MSWRETAALIIRAYREGVALSVKADGKLGWKAAQRPPEALLGALKDHKADILAMIAPSSPSPHVVQRAKRRIAQLRALAFWPYLDDGALGIADETGRRWRSVAEYLPIGEVFDDLVAGLNEDPRLLDAISTLRLTGEAAHRTPPADTASRRPIARRSLPTPLRS